MSKGNLVSTEDFSDTHGGNSDNSIVPWDGLAAVLECQGTGEEWGVTPGEEWGMTPVFLQNHKGMDVTYSNCLIIPRRAE